jgi:hypothetical protein
VISSLKPAKVSAARLVRQHPQSIGGVVPDRPAETAVDPLTGSASSPFQAEPTHEEYDGRDRAPRDNWVATFKTRSGFVISLPQNWQCTGGRRRLHALVRQPATDGRS